MTYDRFSAHDTRISRVSVIVSDTWFMRFTMNAVAVGTVSVLFASVQLFRFRRFCSNYLITFTSFGELRTTCNFTDSMMTVIFTVFTCFVFTFVSFVTPVHESPLLLASRDHLM